MGAIYKRSSENTVEVVQWTGLNLVEVMAFAPGQVMVFNHNIIAVKRYVCFPGDYIIKYKNGDVQGASQKWFEECFIPVDCDNHD